MEKNNGNEDLIKDIEMINKINIYMNSKNILIQFNAYDLMKAKAIFQISNINFIQTKKEFKRKINFIIHSKNKLKLKYDLNNNKFFLLLIYNYIFTFKEIIPFIKTFFINNLISFHTIFFFLDFFLEINEESAKNELSYIRNINSVISNLKKMYKVTKINEINNVKIINKDIYDLLEKIFSKNNIVSISNIIFCKNLMRYPKILSLLKICFDYYENNILNNNNKQFIINHLKKLFLNTLNISHLNYLYKIAKKYLQSDFNNKVQNPKKNYYSFFSGIIDFILGIMKESSPFLIDRYFIFNSSEEKKGILTTSPINVNNYDIHNELNLSFIFSFRPNESDEKNNNNKVILSMIDNETKKNVMKFILNKNNLNLDIFWNNKQKNLSLSENIHHDIDYFCFAYFDNNDNLFYFYLNEDNKDNKIFNLKISFKDIKQIYFEVGNNFENINNQIQKFNGLIGPILVYNSKVVNPLDIYQRLYKIRKYYLLEDIFNKSRINNDNIYFSYNDYFGISNNKNELKIIGDIKKVLNNLIYYINPEIISNNLNFYTESRFRDYKIYNNLFIIKNHYISNKYYEIMDEKNLTDFVLIQNSFIEYFINNNIFDYIILNIELIYNEFFHSEEKNIQEKEYILL